MVWPVVSTTTEPTWTSVRNSPPRPDPSIFVWREGGDVLFEDALGPRLDWDNDDANNDTRLDHPGYFGKVGMRRFHLMRNHQWAPILNVDKLYVDRTRDSPRPWSLIIVTAGPLFPLRSATNTSAARRPTLLPLSTSSPTAMPSSLERVWILLVVNLFWNGRTNCD